MEHREVERMGRSAFDPDVEVLLQQLDSVVRQLPGGYVLKAFGSYVSGTAVPPAVLDLALCQERPHVAEAPGLTLDPVEALAAALVNGQPEKFQMLNQPATRPGKRILAVNFGAPRSRQEILLFVGDHSTGVWDLILKYLLPLHPQGTALVKIVKRWVLRRDLTVRGKGSFNWTLLCVFFLQQHGFLDGS